MTVGQASGVAKANSLGIGGGASLTSATLKLDGLDGNEEMPEGTEFKVLTITGTITGSFAEILPSVPCAGKVWDTTDLKSKGILRVKNDEASAISNISSNANSDKVYDITGKKVKTTDLHSSLFILNGRKIMK